MALDHYLEKAQKSSEKLSFLEEARNTSAQALADIQRRVEVAQLRRIRPTQEQAMRTPERWYPRQRQAWWD